LGAVGYPEAMLLSLCALLNSAHASDVAALPASADGSAETVGGVMGGVVAPKPVDPVLAGDIRTLLQLSGAGDLALQNMLVMLDQMKAVRPDIPDEFWLAFRAEMKGEELVEVLVPVYAAHFSREEVRAMIAFYRTPVGQKLIAETPALAADAMTVGQSWGRELATRVVQKMQATTPPSEP
jgi:hypothetical protein